MQAPPPPRAPPSGPKSVTRRLTAICLPSHASMLFSRPLPKRSSASAGLEDNDLDAWVSSALSPAGVSTAASALVTTPSRKRHHSLPTTNASGHLVAPPHAPVTLSMRPPPHPHLSRQVLPTPSVRSVPKPVHSLQRQEGAEPAAGGVGIAINPGSYGSNQLSPSHRRPPAARSASPFSAVVPHIFSCPTGVAHSFQQAEMSPREGFLVRAFVSDALSLDGPRPSISGPREETGALHRQLPSGSSCSRDVGTASSQVFTDWTDAVAAADPGQDAMPSTPPPPSSSSSHPPVKWTKEEDARLREAVQRFGGKNWKRIAETLGQGRTDVQCLHRWNKVLKPGLVKGPWTPEEDRVLLSLIKRYGVGKIRWCDIALHLPGRIGKQCRERWCNHLDSSIRKGQWTPEEDELVFSLQQQLGNKWSEIAKMLPGRTENAVKNRFNSAARRKWLMARAAARSSSSPRVADEATPKTELVEAPEGLAPPPAMPTTPAVRQVAAPLFLPPSELRAGFLAGPPRLQPLRPPGALLQASSCTPPYLSGSTPFTTTSTSDSLFPRDAFGLDPPRFDRRLESPLYARSLPDSPPASSLLFNLTESDLSVEDNQTDGEAVGLDKAARHGDVPEEHEGPEDHADDSKAEATELMDEHNMTTFLDSVALELDDIVDG
ncbi:hypothetical protein P43SY_007195 [Pythium insidiosum]|uniref:Myb-like DNA-binding protein n=1 Tax=Pythium insidiosum TaxID=114742 RepID=A0AAD5LE41_PYTIN|nr:hypothetical protein P43SY_007195 [Pythium insidiosum]